MQLCGVTRGGSIGYAVSGFNSVEEVVVLTGNRSGRGKNSCGGHPQGDMERSFLQELLSSLGISGIFDHIWSFISHWVYCGGSWGKVFGDLSLDKAVPENVPDFDTEWAQNSFCVNWQVFFVYLFVFFGRFFTSALIFISETLSWGETWNTVKCFSASRLWQQIWGLLEQQLVAVTGWSSVQSLQHLGGNLLHPRNHLEAF